MFPQICGIIFSYLRSQAEKDQLKTPAYALLWFSSLKSLLSKSFGLSPLVLLSWYSPTVTFEQITSLPHAFLFLPFLCFLTLGETGVSVSFSAQHTRGSEMLLSVSKWIKLTHCCLLCCSLFTCVHLFAEAKLLSAPGLLMKSYQLWQKKKAVLATAALRLPEAVWWQEWVILQPVTEESPASERHSGTFPTFGAGHKKLIIFCYSFTSVTFHPRACFLQKTSYIHQKWQNTDLM